MNRWKLLQGTTKKWITKNDRRSKTVLFKELKLVVIKNSYTSINNGETKKNKKDKTVRIYINPKSRRKIKTTTKRVTEHNCQNHKHPRFDCNQIVVITFLFGRWDLWHITENICFWTTIRYGSDWPWNGIWRSTSTRALDAIK